MCSRESENEAQLRVWIFVDSSQGLRFSSCVAELGVNGPGCRYVPAKLVLRAGAGKGGGAVLGFGVFA